jgi:hypothetical protein
LGPRLTMSTADPDTVSRDPPRLLSKFVMR